MRISLYRLRGGLTSLALALTLGGSLLVSYSASAQAAVVPAKTSSCSISKVWHDLGPTYVEKLKVTNTTCGAGETLIKAYNKCRLSHGGAKGKCTAKVDGYKCTEQRQTSPIQFVAVASCTKSRDAVDFTYSEDT